MRDFLRKLFVFLLFFFFLTSFYSFLFEFNNVNSEEVFLIKIANGAQIDDNIKLEVNKQKKANNQERQIKDVDSKFVFLEESVIVSSNDTYDSGIYFWIGVVLMVVGAVGLIFSICGFVNVLKLKEKK